MLVLKSRNVPSTFNLCWYAVIWGLAIAAVWRWECVCCFLTSSFEVWVNIIVLMSITAVPVAVYYRRLTFAKAMLFAVVYGFSVFFLISWPQSLPTNMNLHMVRTFHYLVDLACDHGGFMRGLIIALGPGVVCVLMCRVILGKVVLQNGMMCPGCGYTLLGCNNRVCPECGRGFSLSELA